MNPAIDRMCQHTSIRKFTDDPIPAEQFSAILDAAQGASTSNYLQACSIIRVTDAEKRNKLVEISGGQKWVAEAAEFLVWCVDFHRHQQIEPYAKLGYTEQFLIGVVDTSLMAENALVAAESLGLGGVFIGGIRNQPDEVVKLLGLPEQVFPLFGMCLGYPDQKPTVRPRLPHALIMHENSYTQSADSSLLAQYDTDVYQYYAHRPGIGKVMTWSEQIKGIIKKEARPHMLDSIQRQGFMKK
ncbi:MAG: Oxygen-insensitive NADPH nitroreductase [Candidatus Celerinatantimonas neptuna]|nr:MAG: Oxygen-insensitive NADPH nitroreductase [Candidatus Celerinatantimonas neptuna]